MHKALIENENKKVVAVMNVEEVEDRKGNIYPKNIYRDLKNQGLID